ncbi:MAG: sigma-54-dependent Fis family transcriptional regulator [Gammaproteobacteria bacterium]|nr:sigma-54-dependent Fis family transcriptional regulator [Gammaproteobacteria bacterium]MCW8922953.1 sigma-54-dependent Fis family transcriptional regulator [Gammaproteobacteria bacterium]
MTSKKISKISLGDDTFLDELLNSYTNPTILMDRNYVIIAANAAYQKQYGFRVDGKSHCYEISHHYKKPCDLAGETCPLKLCLESNSAQRSLHVHHTEHGDEHVDVQLSPIHDEAGEIAYFLETMAPVKCASTKPQAEGLVGHSIAFNTVIEMVQRVACSDVSVLLQGESGTGKELVAEAIHKSSSRAKGPFVAVDCSGLTESLFESELFGHEKGAFTGAQSRKIGLVEAASGGTLFLDETGDIPLNLQTKLLRLMETGTFRRVGGIEPLKADFRLVSATHQNLRSMVDAGEFRQDLYYRISAFPLHLPSLRERTEDIPLLVESMLQRFYPEYEITMSKAALDQLQHYPFPGNIRELSNIVQRATLMADGDVIEPQHLPEECAAEIDKGDKTCFSDLISLKELERRYLQWAMMHIDNKTELAKKLGVSERTLYRKLEQLN